MFNNIGKKIKKLVVIVCIIEIAIAVIGGIVLMASGEDALIIVGFLVMLFGSLFAWISSWMLYGYGEIIDKLTDIERNTRMGNSGMHVSGAQVNRAQANGAQTGYAPQNQPAVNWEQVERLYTQGLISEEEYHRLRRQKFGYQ